MYKIGTRYLIRGLKIVTWVKKEQKTGIMRQSERQVGSGRGRQVQADADMQMQRQTQAQAEASIGRHSHRQAEAQQAGRGIQAAAGSVR